MACRAVACRAVACRALASQLGLRKYCVTLQMQQSDWSVLFSVLGTNSVQRPCQTPHDLYRLLQGSKVNVYTGQWSKPESLESTVKASILRVNLLTRGCSCDYRVYGSDRALRNVDTCNLKPCMCTCPLSGLAVNMAAYCKVCGHYCKVQQEVSSGVIDSVLCVIISVAGGP